MKKRKRIGRNRAFYISWSQIKNEKPVQEKGRKKETHRLRVR